MELTRKDHPEFVDLTFDHVMELHALNKEIQETIGGDTENFIATHYLDGSTGDELHYSLDFKHEDLTVSLVGPPEYGEAIEIQSMVLDLSSSPR